MTWYWLIATLKILGCAVGIVVVLVILFGLYVCIMIMWDGEHGINPFN